MPYFGAHMSVAGGCFRALEQAKALDCTAVQLFTKNSNQWNAKPLSEEDVRQFHALRTHFQYLLAHDSYLINLASPDPALFRRSIDAFIVELERAEQLGLHYLVTHPGAHVGSGDEEGLARVVTALDEIHEKTNHIRTMVLLETTAGQGTSLGHRFEHIGFLLRQTKQSHRLGVCVDSCHVFAAGYEWTPRKNFLALMRQLDEVIGLERILAFHLNDSAKPLGSRVDRHAHLGKGHIGLEAFGMIVRERRFRDRPMVLETPKENYAGEPMDPVNLGILRELLKN